MDDKRGGSNSPRRKLSKISWGLLALWLALELYLFGAGLWSFRQPQTAAIQGARFEYSLAAGLYGFPSGLFIAPALGLALKAIGLDLYGVATAVDWTLSWLLICACGFAQWYFVLRGLESVVRRFKIRLGWEANR